MDKIISAGNDPRSGDAPQSGRHSARLAPFPSSPIWACLYQAEHRCYRYPAACSPWVTGCVRPHPRKSIHIIGPPWGIKPIDPHNFIAGSTIQKRCPHNGTCLLLWHQGLRHLRGQISTHQRSKSSLFQARVPWTPEYKAPNETAGPTAA